jgi:rhodanese-related sulfurtransferase
VNAVPEAPSGEVGESVSASGGSFTRVAPTELRGMMQKQDLELVNTHVPFEGNIPATDLSIPYDEIGHNLDRLPGKEARIVLYCRSGNMSAEAARTLVGLGYDDVWDLRGGMIAWEEAGFRLKGA